MVDIKVDMSEVHTYAVDLGKIPGELSRHLVPVMKKAAQVVKTDLQEDFRGSSNKAFRQIASFVRYDDIAGGGPVFETEIGVDRESAGKLGNIAVYGTPKGGGTHAHPEEYLAKEVPVMVKALGVAAEAVLNP